MTTKWKLLLLITCAVIIAIICISFSNTPVKVRLNLVIALRPFARIVDRQTVRELPQSFHGRGFVGGLVYSHGTYIGYVTPGGYFIDESLQSDTEEVHAEALQEIHSWVFLAFVSGMAVVLGSDLTAGCVGAVLSRRRSARTT